MFHGVRTEAALEYGDEAVTKSIWVPRQELLTEVRLSLQGLSQVAMMAAPTDPFHMTPAGRHRTASLEVHKLDVGINI